MSQTPGAPQIPKSPRRRLDFPGQSGISAGAPSPCSDDSRRSEQSSPRQPHHSFPMPASHLPNQQSAPNTHSFPRQQNHSSVPVPSNSQTHPPQNDASFSAESATRRRTKKSLFSPTSSLSSPPIRNSLSSHASDMGRRLAQERSRNYEFMQKISELEHTVSLLQQGKHHNIGMDQQPPGSEFSSSPVATPTRGGAVNSSKENGFFGMHRLEELEEALRVESQRREEAERKAAHLLQQSNLNNRNNNSFEIASDSSVEELLEQASKLLDITATTSTKSHASINQDGNGGSLITQERMQEYHELVTDFHSEQQSHGDIDGEETIPREDILWLLHELKWRFEEIYSGYAENKSTKKDAHLPDINEWKECLRGLSEVVKKATKPTEANIEQGDEHTNDTHILQDEISSLNQRLESFASQHNETCRSLYDDMEAMKRDYQDQIVNKSQCIQNLESKISEQEEYIAQIQKERQSDQKLIQEENQKLILSKEGTATRIRYLEGMLRSLQMELKESKTSQGKKGGTQISTPNRTDEEQETLSPPVFMRDLTSAMHVVDLIQHKTTQTENTTVNHEAKDKAAGGRSKQDDNTTTTSSSSNNAEITKLLEQISTLGNSLADSEMRRANLLDDFQQERKKYMSQYKETSEMLKQLLEEKKKTLLKESLLPGK